MSRIVAIVGLPGSGKSVAVEAFEASGFSKVYFGAITIEKVKERGLEVNEKNEREVRESLRKEHGMAVYAKLNLEKIKQLSTKNNGVVIDGLYSWEEYLFLKEAFPSLLVVAVYAPPSLRYSRLSTRRVRPLSKQEAYSRDVSQIEKLHQAGPIAMADVTVVNDGDFNDFKNKVEAIINEE